MSWTERLAIRVGNAATRRIGEMVHAMPHYDSAESHLRDAHDRWKKTEGRLGWWFLPDAKLDWVQNGWEDPKITCIGGYHFTRDSGNLLWTDDGQSSWNAWWASNGQGLTQTRPPMPKPLQGLGGSEYGRLLQAQGWDKVTFH